MWLESISGRLPPAYVIGIAALLAALLILVVVRATHRYVLRPRRQSTMQTQETDGALQDAVSGDATLQAGEVVVTDSTGAGLGHTAKSEADREHASDPVATGDASRPQNLEKLLETGHRVVFIRTARLRRRTKMGKRTTARFH